MANSCLVERKSNDKVSDSAANLTRLQKLALPRKVLVEATLSQFKHCMKPDMVDRMKTKIVQQGVLLSGPVRVSRRLAAKKGIDLPETTIEDETEQLAVSDASCSDEDTDAEDKKQQKAQRKTNVRVTAKRVRRRSPDADEPIKLTTFTVEQLYRRYRPDLLSHPSKPSTSKEATKVAKVPAKDGDESESSGDDYLVDPSKLDLSSDFFRSTAQEKEERQAVDLFFDCNAGIELTDSENESDSGDVTGPQSSTGANSPPENQIMGTDVELGLKLMQQISQSTEVHAQALRLAEPLPSCSSKPSISSVTLKSGDKCSLNTAPSKEDHREVVASILHTGERLAKQCGKSSLTAGIGRTDFVAVPTIDQSAKAKDIEITLKASVTTDSKGKKRTFDALSALKRFMNREKREAQINLHKVSLLCWIGHGTYVNNELRKPSLIRLMQRKLLPGARSNATRPNGLTNLRYFQELTRFYRRTITLKDTTMFYRRKKHPNLGPFLIFAISRRMAYCKRDYILLFALLLRSLGVYCRLVISATVPPKQVPPDQLYKMVPQTARELAMERELLHDFRQAPQESMVYVAKQKLLAQIAKQRERTVKSDSVRKRKGFVDGFTIPQLDGGADDVGNRLGGKKMKLMETSFLTLGSNRPKAGTSHASESKDPAGEAQRRRQRILAAYRARAARFTSKSNQTRARNGGDCKIKANQKGKLGVDYWVEVFCEHEDKWVTIDVLNGSVHRLEDVVKQATQPIAYVLAWHNDGTIKDVSPRYISRFGSKKSKLRVNDAWLEEALGPYRGTRNKRDIIEDIKFERLLNKRPFPEQIGEYRNHPKYAIERFLRRNEAIYPPDAPIVGRIREEAIYLRNCIYTLYSRDGWLRQAKTVRLYEEPYKAVKAKHDRFKGTATVGDQMVELFGEWQVQDYEPPVAKDGLVPRTAYGNVDLFKPCMLPKGTVHLQLPGLNRICRRLRVDCAQAITGFEYRKGGCQAVYDGFVVCEEFREQVVDEWYQEQMVLAEKEQERRRKRIYANWRRLIVGIRIRKKLKDRYNFDNM
ncbi:DNA repair protein complementing XP-C cells homolog [Anopheles bellator]|uniref:DNA repair protein complementing XP-C cells homolog n=1 Tax=Anopheles bellator TaxID=139047 RepID=UPI002649E14B|nr:DNA repair protein complementing XP-C cells homolog [Anopheles bellator]